MPSQDVTINGKPFIAEVKEDGSYSSISQKPVPDPIIKAEKIEANIFDIVVDELVSEDENGDYDFSTVIALQSLVKEDAWVQAVISGTSSGFTKARLDKLKAYILIKVGEGALTQEVATLILEKLQPLEDALA